MSTNTIVGLSVLAAATVFSAFVFGYLGAFWRGFWSGVRAGVYRTVAGDHEWFETNAALSRDCGGFNFSVRPLRRLFEMACRDGCLVTITANRIVYVGRDGVKAIGFGDCPPERAVAELYRLVEPNATEPVMPDRP